MYKLGIDLGGTKIEGIIIADGEVIYKKRVESNVSEGYQSILNKVAQLHQDLMLFIGDSSHTLGIGTPGSISPNTGRLKNCNITAMNGKQLLSDLQEKIGAHFSLENDANCFVVGEATHFSAKQPTCIFGAVLGTGCGAGILVNDVLLTGATQLAGEWGHMSINSKGPQCYCGRKGCVERYVSGKGLEEQYRIITSSELTFEGIMNRYRAGGLIERKFFDNFISNLAYSLANIITILDPEIIIIGGGIAKVDEIFELLPAQVRKQLNREAPIFSRPSLGESSCAIGAALIGGSSRPNISSLKLAIRSDLAQQSWTRV